MNILTKNATLITGGLIFLGYCQYHFYFGAFGIDIYNYINTTELLLSFFPVLVSNFIPLAIFVYLAIIRPDIKYRTQDGKDFTKKIKIREKKREPIKLIKYIIFYSRINPKTKFRLFIMLVIHPLTIAFGLLIGMTITFWTLASQNSKWTEAEGLFYLISIGWLVFIIEPIISNIASESEFAKKHTNFMQKATLFNYFLILTYFILFSQKIKAWKILNGETFTKVQITLKTNETISTDSTLIYIGQTSNYIFLRNKKDADNIIINTSNIEKLQKSTRK
ncbi:MAG: hypothetical protein KJ712_07590 [Bacteroidetes bacterium]|nr:hypothetical protein [Bacteroidota bacterium]MBU1486062.1 hypothetical protein [Bacteroidota bacterium]MBU2046576.1 hypothetical protein [Bacteroidota bacterium]MBU2267958.1 hypothetical protein [Bacteroidota bacterium]MBU2375298.1 hypothetical protein [Bacteroidota bacterium]